jgi:hypothetical protein
MNRRRHLSQWDRDSIIELLDITHRPVAIKTSRFPCLDSGPLIASSSIDWAQLRRSHLWRRRNPVSETLSYMEIGRWALSGDASVTNTSSALTLPPLKRASDGAAYVPGVSTYTTIRGNHFRCSRWLLVYSAHRFVHRTVQVCWQVRNAVEHLSVSMRWILLGSFTKIAWKPYSVESHPPGHHYPLYCSQYSHTPRRLPISSHSFECELRTASLDCDKVPDFKPNNTTF